MAFFTPFLDIPDIRLRYVIVLCWYFFRTSNAAAAHFEGARDRWRKEKAARGKVRVGKLKSSRSIGAAISRNDLC